MDGLFAPVWQAPDEIMQNLYKTKHPLFGRSLMASILNEPLADARLGWVFGFYEIHIYCLFVEKKTFSAYRSNTHNVRLSWAQYAEVRWISKMKPWNSNSASRSALHFLRPNSSLEFCWRTLVGIPLMNIALPMQRQLMCHDLHNGNLDAHQRRSL